MLTRFCVFKKTVWICYHRRLIVVYARRKSKFSWTSMDFASYNRDCLLLVLGILLILQNRLAYLCSPLPLTYSVKEYHPFSSYQRRIGLIEFIPDPICISACGCCSLLPTWKFWHIVWSVVSSSQAVIRWAYNASAICL